MVGLSMVTGGAVAREMEKGHDGVRG